MFLLWAVWLAVPYLGLGPSSYVRIHDNADSTLALRASLGTAAAPHFASAWNPLPLAGLDQGPLINCGLDADGWLFALLPGWLAYGLVMLAQRFIAGYFTFRLLRDRLRLSISASLCGGLVYALFAQVALNYAWAGFTLYHGLSLACLPLLFWGLDERPGLRLPRVLWFAAALGFLLGFTSHYSIGAFVVLAVWFWLLVRRQRPVRQTLMVIVAFTLVWLLAEAPVILSSAFNAAESNRSMWALYNSSLTAQFSERYSDVRGILLDNRVMIAAALLGLVATRLRDRRLLVALGASAAVLVITLLASVWTARIAPHAGPLAGFRVFAIYTLAPFAIIVSGALGLDAIAVQLRDQLSVRDRWRGRVWASSATLLVLLVVALLASARVQVYILRDMQAGSTYRAVYERPKLQELAQSAGSQPYRVATVYAPQALEPMNSRMVLRGQLPAYAWAYGLETVDGYVQFYPESYQQFWGYVTKPGLQQDSAMRRYYWSFGGRVYLFVPDTGEPLKPTTDLASICDSELLSLANVRYLISPVKLRGAGLRSISEDPDGEPWPLYLYENMRVLPRYFFVQSTRIFPDQPHVLSAMAAASLQELGTIAFLEGRDTVESGATLGGASEHVRLTSYEADRQVLSVQATGQSLLVCTLSYNRFWHAYVDGKEASVRLVDGTFLGVSIPTGSHDVELRYLPPYHWLFPGWASQLVTVGLAGSRA